MIRMITDVYKTEEGDYVEWSTDTDAPVSYIMTREQMRLRLIMNNYTDVEIRNGVAAKSVEEILERADRRRE